ncbi:MAG: alpha/beta hydrolase [Candidatus Saccharibacteria bacterium]|nr:alpha/beta hydrolase [Rhodoferax sp.]
MFSFLKPSRRTAGAALPSLLSLLFAATASLAAVPADALTARPAAIPVHEESFVQANGIEHWVTIHGSNAANPVVLFLHGGPGNPNTPYAQAVYGAWAQDFTLVQWDQRGAGKTFGRNPGTADSVLTIDLMVSDGLAIAEYVAKRLGQKKVILMGSSWGSALGVHMAQRRPDLFHAYVGTAQLVSERANLAAFYAKTLQLAGAAADDKTVAALTALGAPPWQNPRAFGVVRRASRALEAARTTAPPAHWWRPAAAYATPQALAEAEAGEEYSWLQFVGLKNNGMAATINLPALGTRFALPVFLVQGTEDLLTPLSVTQPYFDSIEAPTKALVLVPLAGHDPNAPTVAAQLRVLKERVLPLVRK